MSLGPQSEKHLGGISWWMLSDNGLRGDDPQTPGRPRKRGLGAGLSCGKFPFAFVLCIIFLAVFCQKIYTIKSRESCLMCIWFFLRTSLQKNVHNKPAKSSESVQKKNLESPAGFAEWPWRAGEAIQSRGMRGASLFDGCDSSRRASAQM